MSLKAGRARPKSQILSLQSLLARMFLGLRSRWKTRAAADWRGVGRGQGQRLWRHASVHAEVLGGSMEGGMVGSSLLHADWATEGCRVGRIWPWPVASLRNPITAVASVPVNLAVAREAAGKAGMADCVDGDSDTPTPMQRGNLLSLLHAQAQSSYFI